MPGIVYASIDAIPRNAWPSQFFSPAEIACKGTGEILVNVAALAALDEFRRQIGGPVHLSSAYRSAYHNARVGGAPLSQHRLGAAFDVVLDGRSKEEIKRVADAVGLLGQGMSYQTFVHLDTGRARTW